MGKEERKHLSKQWERTAEIFKPWGGPSSSVLLVSEMIEKKLVSFTIEHVRLAKPIDFSKIDAGPGGTETVNHMILKYNACLLLRKSGEDEPLIEHELMDVYSPKLKIRVECGHTDPNRLVDGFHSGDFKEFWVLHYPEEGEQIASLYKFKPSKDCKRILASYFARQMAEMSDGVT